MKAIVFGASGYLGSALVKELINQQIPVMALYRKEPSADFLANFQEATNKGLYVCEVLENGGIENLASSKRALEFAQRGDCVFYNFAWRGGNRLKDGSFAEQFKNVTVAANAVVVAAKLKCSKFVHASSQDEAIYAQALRNLSKGAVIKKEDIPYGSAKLIAKQMCLIEAYINKIDFVNTRFSAVIDKSLSSPSFICTNLKKITIGEDFVVPSNPNKIEINYLPDLVNAYIAVGKKGKNKGDYYLGQGQLHTLKDYFTYAHGIKNVFADNCSACEVSANESFINIALTDLEQEIFDNNTFITDTGFKFQYSFKDMVEDILR